ncbi:MAG: hypothetical protein WBA28_02795, partial [Microbacteriaceae bacterium]
MITVSPLETPPGFRIDLDAGENKTFTQARVRRDGVLIRNQPTTGGRLLSLFDYEAPFGVPVTYTVQAQVSEVVTFDPVYVKDWANTSGWSNVG